MKDKDLTRPTLVDLFSGCGGFGLGGELAGFHSTVAVDVDPILQSSYQLNFPSTNVRVGDLGEMNAAGWKVLLGGLPVDGVIGGPPCQGYSRLGVSDPKDVRRTLLHVFFRSVNFIRPKFFVMENVEGLLDKKNMPELASAIAELDSIYTVLPPIVLDASDFGLPTKRKRVFVIGYNPNHVDPVDICDFRQVCNTTYVRDAISDLPSPIAQTSKEAGFGWARYDNSEQISSYARTLRQVPPNHLGSKLAIEQLKKGMVSGNYGTIHTEAVAKRYAATEPGKTDKISRSKRLAWDGFCPTLRAGTGSDRGSYQAVRPLHPGAGRVITVREAARLQSFPDWFLFHKAKWHSFRMIGNSVPPLLASSILKILKQKISDNSAQRGDAVINFQGNLL
ncbi:DNA (cytosine-5-)-methyltransferase [Sulfitobacter pontiacus]|uniref:DNA cytosine methyltransferase n=1 Tax=Sulfitobacter pontiacus TaxID=60137 RepID=UPI0030ED1800